MGRRITGYSQYKLTNLRFVELKNKQKKNLELSETYSITKCAFTYSLHLISFHHGCKKRL